MREVALLGDLLPSRVSDANVVEADELLQHRGTDWKRNQFTSLAASSLPIPRRDKHALNYLVCDENAT